MTFLRSCNYRKVIGNILQAPNEETPVYHHFVAFVQRNGVLYELGKKLIAKVIV